MVPGPPIGDRLTQTLLLIRHGDVEEAYRKRFRGRLDVALSPRGEAQALSVRNALRKESVDAVLASPLERTRKTAAPFCATPELSEGLLEIDFGLWDGLTFDEIAAQWPGQVDRWAAFDPTFGFPGGETLQGFGDRMEQLRKALVARPEKTLALFTHGGVVRMLICKLLGLDIRHYLLFESQVGSISRVTLFPEGRGVLTGLNDISHLKEEGLE